MHVRSVIVQQAAMFTASSMAFAVEAMGMAWPGSASHPAMTRSDPRGVNSVKRADCEQAAEAVVMLLGRKIVRSRLLKLVEECTVARVRVMTLGVW